MDHWSSKRVIQQVNGDTRKEKICDCCFPNLDFRITIGNHRASPDYIGKHRSLLLSEILLFCRKKKGIVELD